MTRAKPKRGPGRPKGSGSNGARVDLQVPPGLKAAVVAAAKAEGIPAQEWWRRAALGRLRVALQVPISCYAPDHASPDSDP